MITLELWPDFRSFANLQLTGEPTSMLVQFDPYIRYSVYTGEIARSARSSTRRHDRSPARRSLRPARGRNQHLRRRRRR